MPVLILDEVSKNYGDNTVVHKMSLKIDQGELVTFLGPSGCGKTTTLRMIGGFVDVSSGNIHVSGRDVTRLSPAKRNMGFVFQSYALFPHMTVSENVAFGLQMRKIDKSDIARRVIGALKRVRLQHLAERLPKQLSGGQQQRVALARALVIEPTVLLLDEPLSNLDAKLRQEMKTEIRQLQKGLDLTTIFVTHDQDEALSMSDRLVVMSAGRVEQIGTPREIFDQPASEFVADFMGFSNLIPVTIGPNGGVLKNRIPIRIKGASGCAGPRVLALRSEHLSLSITPAASPDNTIAVVVEALTYRGSFVDYAVRLDDGTRLSVRGNAEKLYNPGDRAYVAWSPSAGAILQDASNRAA